jgi:hypothetical protein
MSDPFEKLPQAPGAADGGLSTRAARPVPGPVNNAFYLMLVRVALGLVSVIVLFATKDDLKQEILRKTPTASDATVNSTIGVAAGFSVVILIFYLFLAFRVRAGANWARIVTWVFAGLGVLGLLLSFAQTSTGLDKTFTVVEGLIDLAIIVLLALGESNRYFRR